MFFVSLVVSSKTLNAPGQHSHANKRPSLDPQPSTLDPEVTSVLPASKRKQASTSLEALNKLRQGD